jgi:hypothetical protein
MEYKRYWGDLHTHCAISYGYGSLERAMVLGRDHLDFCSVVGHATWHDMPTDRERHGFVIDFHKEGFERLARNWKTMQETVARHNDPGQFVTFLSYEWHSCAYGDHNVYYLEDDGEIVERDSLDELEAALKGKEVMMHPHHIGYGAGYRGINWEHFESRRSPAIEIFSGHGGSERDGGPYPMYHTMGPRQHTGTVAHGLDLGKRFGFLAGTDHHAGYPGHYGEGRTAVYAPELTRRGIWDAIHARRCYAVTGDRIGLSFGINGATMGEEMDASGPRTVTVEVAGCDALDRVEVVKNNRPLKRVFGPEPPRELRDPVTAKIRVEWGWGDKDAPIRWDADIRLSEGELLSVEPCFTGDAILAPGADKGGVADSDEIPHKITAQDVRGVSWYSHTSGNPHPYLRSTNALILEVRGPRCARLQLNANGYKAAYSLSDLLEGSRCEFIRGWRSEAILTHRAIPEQMLQTSLTFEDEAENETDIYYARVSQENNQWAWASPIWVQA